LFPTARPLSAADQGEKTMITTLIVAISP